MEANPQTSGLCRVCLQSQISKGLSLFENYKHAYIFEHINLLANIEIEKNDGLPDKICTICLLELETALNFTKKCRNSDTVLKRGTIGKIKPEYLFIDEDRDEFIKKEESDCNDIFLPNSVSTDNISKPCGLKFQCHDCGNYFKSKRLLRIHWKKIHLLELLVCKICKKQCKSYQALYSHIKRASKDCLVGMTANIVGIGKNRVYHCKDCDYQTKHASSMRYHTNVHSGDRPYSCKMCPKAYGHLSTLQSHMETVHKQYKIEITCQYCGKFIQGRQNYFYHRKLHEKKELKCELCSKVMRNEKILKQHMLRHTGEKSFTCESCAKSFYSMRELTAHKRRKHSETNSLGLELDSKNQLLSCNVCPYKCVRHDTLKKHKLRHTDTNVCCITCGSFFDDAESLNVHQKRHLDLKYECPECGKKFFAKKSIWKHVQKVHNQSFSTRTNKVKEKITQNATLGTPVEQRSCS